MAIMDKKLSWRSTKSRKKQQQSSTKRWPIRKKVCTDRSFCREKVSVLCSNDSFACIFGVFVDNASAAKYSSLVRLFSKAHLKNIYCH